MVIKNRDILLYISILFILSAMLNFFSGLITCDKYYMIELSIINLCLSLPFIVMYKLECKLKIELIIASLLYCWVIFRVCKYQETVLNYSIALIYSSMLIVKISRNKILSSIMVLLVIFSLSTLGILVSKDIPTEITKNILLIILMGIIHYKMYYSSYKETPDIKKLYNLTKLDMIILDALFLPDPCLKTIQDHVLSKDKHCSNTYVKDRLQQLYKIFDVAKGGSRKTELLGKIIRLGYKI